LQLPKKKEEVGKFAGCQWLTPVIPATQEDFGSKPAWANSFVSQKKKKKKSTTKEPDRVA
jgi:hypothetical protein